MPQIGSVYFATVRKEKMMACFGEKSVCYPIVIVSANGIQCRVLVDTGAASSYASAALINSIGTSPVRQETRQIQSTRHYFNPTVILERCSLMTMIPKQNYHSTLFLKQVTSQKSRPTCQLGVVKLVSQWLRARARAN